MYKFSSESRRVKKRQFFAQLNREINQKIEAYITAHRDEMTKEFIDAGCTEEEIDERFTQLKLKAQIAMHKAYKQNLKEIRERKRLERNSGDSVEQHVEQEGQSFKN